VDGAPDRAAMGMHGDVEIFVPITDPGIITRELGRINKELGKIGPDIDRVLAKINNEASEERPLPR